MSSHVLQGEIRSLTGKQVKTLRQNGKLPATVYGKGVEPQTITVLMNDFSNVYQETGETGLIELIVDGKKHPVLIHTVQRDPVSAVVLHIEFHEVNLKEKVHAEVPIELTGETTAVKEKLGVLLPLMDHIDVEALPTDLPEKVTVDIAALAAVNDQIIVGEIAVPANVTVLTDPTLIVVKIGAFVVEKEPEPTPEEVAAAAGAEVPAEPGEETVPTETENAPEKPQTEEK